MQINSNEYTGNVESLHQQFSPNVKIIKVAAKKYTKIWSPSVTSEWRLPEMESGKGDVGVGA